MGNGTVTFFTDPTKAAAQAVADVSAFQTQQAQQAGGLGVAPILIAGAKETQYKNVIEVLDEAKRAGFQKVGLETASASK